MTWRSTFFVATHCLLAINTPHGCGYEVNILSLREVRFASGSHTIFKLRTQRACRFLQASCPTVCFISPPSWVLVLIDNWKDVRQHWEDGSWFYFYFLLFNDLVWRKVPGLRLSKTLQDHWDECHWCPSTTNYMLVAAAKKFQTDDVLWSWLMQAWDDVYEYWAGTLDLSGGGHIIFNIL